MRGEERDGEGVGWLLGRFRCLDGRGGVVWKKRKREEEREREKR